MLVIPCFLHLSITTCGVVSLYDICKGDRLFEDCAIMLLLYCIWRLCCSVKAVNAALSKIVRSVRSVNLFSFLSYDCSIRLQPLIETLDEYRKINPEDLLKSEPSVCIVPMPPQFIPMANKPMFFDLALNHIKVFISVLLSMFNHGSIRSWATQRAWGRRIWVLPKDELKNLGLSGAARRVYGLDRLIFVGKRV